MGKRKGETWHWTSDIITVHQGDKYHCGGQIVVKVCAATYETDNQWREGDEKKNSANYAHSLIPNMGYTHI